MQTFGLNMLKDLVDKNVTVLQLVNSKNQFADILTKGSLRDEICSL